jgi:hypothetical protein
VARFDTHEQSLAAELVIQRQALIEEKAGMTYFPILAHRTQRGAGTGRLIGQGDPNHMGLPQESTVGAF